MKINRIEFLINILCLIVIFIIGCSGGGDDSSDTESPDKIKILKSEKNRIAYPYVSESESETLTAGNTEFAVKLYHALSEKNNGNIFFSPYSISLAFAMIYAGAENETEMQIAESLCFNLSQERLHPVFNNLDQEIASRGEKEDENIFILNIVNAMWGQRDYYFLPSYLDILAENYGAELKLVDFYNDPEVSRIAVNEWVSENTGYKIKDILSKGAVSSSVKFILTNAVYFKALWKYQFDKKETRNEYFDLITGIRESVPMMTQKGIFNYTEGDGYQAVELPYYITALSEISISAEEECQSQDEELSMVIILPEAEKFTEFEEELSADKFRVISENLKNETSSCKIKVELTMPKFSYESGSISLREILTNIGMPVAFTSDADLSGMDGTYNLSIGDAVHKAFISVDENGTEAGSVTVIVSPVSSPDEPVIMNINRPFIFFIRDIETETVLFLGRVMNP